jgi:hypothetical protein
MKFIKATVVLSYLGKRLPARWGCKSAPKVGPRSSQRKSCRRFESGNNELEGAPALYSRSNCTECIMRLLLLSSDSSQVESADDRRRHLAHDGGRIRGRHNMHATRGWTTSDCASGCDGRDSPPRQQPSRLVPPPRAGWRGAQPPSQTAWLPAPNYSCLALARFLALSLSLVRGACFCCSWLFFCAPTDCTFTPIGV